MFLVGASSPTLSVTVPITVLVVGSRMPVCTAAPEISALTCAPFESFEEINLRGLTIHSHNPRCRKGNLWTGFTSVPDRMTAEKHPVQINLQLPSRSCGKQKVAGESTHPNAVLLLELASTRRRRS